MQDPPDAIQLLEAAREHLSESVVPALDDRGLRFRTRVAANVLAILERELSASEEAAREEYRRLTTLLGETQMTIPRGSHLVVLLRAATRRLYRRVSLGEFDADPRKSELLSHLKRTAVNKLWINNPRYLARIAKEDPAIRRLIPTERPAGPADQAAERSP